MFNPRNILFDHVRKILWRNLFLGKWAYIIYTPICIYYQLVNDKLLIS